MLDQKSRIRAYVTVGEREKKKCIGDRACYCDDNINNNNNDNHDNDDDYDFYTNIILAHFHFHHTNSFQFRGAPYDTYMRTMRVCLTREKRMENIHTHEDGIGDG